MPDETVLLLAQRTRGMRRFDIRRVVTDYLRTGALPPEPSHPTNTCDPITGNWCEKLLDPEKLAAILRKQGLCVRTLAGYYGSGAAGSWVKRAARIAANIAIRRSGCLGLRLAPFYCLSATRA